MKIMKLARGLGWFSIGLGLVELLAPRWFARKIGTPDRPGLIRSFGAREVLAGVGALAQKNPARSIWARTAGDVLDAAALGMAMRSAPLNRKKIGAAAALVGGAALVDLLTARRLSRAHVV
jgi:hypothetical protein